MKRLFFLIPPVVIAAGVFFIRKGIKRRRRG